MRITMASWPSPLITSKRTKTGLSFLLPRLLSTVPLPAPQAQATAEAEPLVEEEEEDRVAITNRSYWTRRVHALCSAARDPDAALRLLDRLRLRGYRPDSLNLASVVHVLCAAGRAAEAHSRLLLSAASGWLPDDRTANILLARLLGARTPGATLQVLHALTEAKPSFVPSLTNYNRLIHGLCSRSLTPEARSLLIDMKTNGRLPNAISYTSLINGLSQNGELDDARQVFNEMLENGIKPNSLTYSVLIKGVLRKRRVEEARELMHELWSKMEEEKEQPVNSAAFANLIDSLCREGFFHEVFRIAEDMPQGKCVAEEFAYSQMMDSLCRAGKHHGASRIVYIMRKRGFVPSLVSYNCVVHGLSKDRGSMRAYQLFTEGIGFGYSLPESTYKVLVEGLCREMDIQKAKDVTELMLQKDGIDKTRIYNLFLSSLQLVDNPSEQLNVLVSMLQKQCRPDVVTLNTVIHGFCKIGRVNEAKKILNDMLMGKFCAPDVVTFTTIIHGLLDVGRLEEALDVFHSRMPEASCTPNVVTYNVVLGGLCKLQKVDKAMEIFNEMKGRSVCADSTTYTVIINGLFDMDQLEEAKKFWDEVIWPSKIHDDCVYAAILRGLCCLGKLNEACDFLYELADCGVAPGIVNYNILIDCACKHCLKREAYQIVSEMRKNGLELDAVTWRILDRFHEKEMKADGVGNGSSVLEDISEERTMTIGVEFEDSSIIHDKREWSETIEKCEDTLEGLVDPSSDDKLIEESNNEDHDVIIQYGISGVNGTKNPSQLQEREPLSRIARRAFGLL